MYTPGKIIYFDPFHFKDGGSKPKYFLVLKQIGDQVILASLPSSQKHLPASMEVVHGCLELPDSGISCYVFKANAPITKEGWCFPLDTFLFGQWLDEYHLPTLRANYTIKGVDFEIVGELTDDELDTVIACFRNSANVKRKFKRLLSE